MKLILWCCLFIFNLSSLKAFAFPTFEKSVFKAPSQQQKAWSFETGLYHLNFYNEQSHSDSYGLIGAEYKNKGFLFKGRGFVPVTQDQVVVSTFPEAYYSVKRSNWRFSFGRKIEEWSAYEEYKPVGLWNNAWDLNKNTPEREGLLGTFFEYSKSGSKVLFFASPFSVPKLVRHQDFESNGDVTPLTPWGPSPPKRIEYNGRDVNVRYSLEVDYLEQALQPQIGGRYEHDGKKFFSRVSYLYGQPKNMGLNLGFKVDAATSESPVDVDIEITKQRVHRGALDFGYKWNKNSITTVSLNYRKLDGVDYLTDRSYIGLGSGEVFQLFHETKFFKNKMKAVVFLNENTAIQNESRGELDSLLKENLSVPFRFRRGIGASLQYKINSKYYFSAMSYYDLKLKGAQGTLKFSARLGSRVFAKAGFGFVEALNNTSKGFYKDFRKNDYVYGGLSFVL